jgi:hypothetical protein
LRRDQNLDVTDRITLSIQTTPRAIEAFKKHEAYILGDTLVTKVNFGTVEGAPIDLNGEVTVIAIEKA